MEQYDGIVQTEVAFEMAGGRSSTARTRRVFFILPERTRAHAASRLASHLLNLLAFVTPHPMQRLLGAN